MNTYARITAGLTLAVLASLGCGHRGGGVAEEADLDARARRYQEFTARATTQPAAQPAGERVTGSIGTLDDQVYLRLRDEEGLEHYYRVLARSEGRVTYGSDRKMKLTLEQMEAPPEIDWDRLERRREFRGSALREAPFDPWHEPIRETVRMNLDLNDLDWSN